MVRQSLQRVAALWLQVKLTCKNLKELNFHRNHRNLTWIASHFVTVITSSTIDMAITSPVDRNAFARYGTSKHLTMFPTIFLKIQPYWWISHTLEWSTRWVFENEMIKLTPSKGLIVVAGTVVLVQFSSSDPSWQSLSPGTQVKSELTNTVSHNAKKATKLAYHHIASFALCIPY